MIVTRRRSVFSLVLFLALLLPPSCRRENREQFGIFYSPEFTVDGIYRSMQGPVSSIEFDLYPSEKPELVWLTGFRSIVVDPQDRQLEQSYMCHTNLVYRGLETHRKRVRSQIRKTKLFTISQGETEARFPPGFGLPVIAGLPGKSFGVFNQLLNVNYTDFEKLRPKLRYRNTVFFVRESERSRPMRPLYQALGQVMAAVGDQKAIFNLPEPSKTQSEASCSGGESASMIFKDRFGRPFTYHWKLPPGRETRQTLITRTMLKLEHDTTIHHIVAHMHPYGESLALKDLTKNEILFESKMHSYKDKIGVAKVEHYSSAAGIPVYRDHDYALVSKYDNTTDETHDAMAIMYFFLLDKSFETPTL